MQDELIDIVDKNGKHTGEIRLKSEAHSLGLYHTSVHLWCYTLDGNVLLQKRAADKDTYPDLWDISVAGHIGAGETPENAVLRETEEEIGLCITKADIRFLKMFLAKKRPTPVIIDNEFHYVFLSELKVPIEKLRLQKEEVSDIELISLTTLKKQLTDPELVKKYVPHGSSYFDYILAAIEKNVQSKTT